MISIVYTTKLWFNPVTTPVNWRVGGGVLATTTTSAGGFNSVYPPVEWSALPMTTFCSGLIIVYCQTYSMDQITTLTNVPTPTTAVISIPVPTTSGQTTSPIIIVTVPVQSSGYYWSPVPNPTPPTIPWPTLPPLRLPPVPTLPCINVGLIKINCPPNKSAPTTRFNTGPPKPTCTAKCGTICSMNCDTTGNPTSEPETETECETSTVTDIFVSCQTGVCTTTKSSVVSGCDIQATSTTTEAPYCPSGVPGDQEEETDDQNNPLVVRGTEIAGQPQNGVAIMGTKRYAIFYAPSTTGWFWHYKSQDIGLPSAMLTPGTVTSAVYPSNAMPFPTVLIIPPIPQATRLAVTAPWLEVREFWTTRDCELCVGDDCLERAGGKFNPECCVNEWCPPPWAMCNCNPAGECAGTDPECCFDGAGINC